MINKYGLVVHSLVNIQPKKKLLKVLDQIQYNMELFEHELTMVFQMPTDTEVDEV